MKKLNVVIIVGSLRKDSYNLKLAKALAKLGQNDFESHIANISDLPLFNQDLESAFPAEASRLKKEIQEADAVLFVTPEYNRSIPAPLKNAIDWASRPYGQNAFAKKPAALCGTSPGAIGTAVSQNMLKQVFSYLDIALMGPPEVYLQFKDGLIDNDGNVSDVNTQKFLGGFVSQFVAWIQKHK